MRAPDPELGARTLVGVDESSVLVLTGFVAVPLLCFVMERFFDRVLVDVVAFDGDFVCGAASAFGVASAVSVAGLSIVRSPWSFESSAGTSCVDVPGMAAEPPCVVAVGGAGGS